MDSKKVVRGRAARLPRRSDYTRQFQKDWSGLQAKGINLAVLKEALALLVANDGPLPPEWKDHPLKGTWSDFRECHAGGDLLLIYRLSEDDGSVTFVRAGTHTRLFD